MTPAGELVRDAIRSRIRDVERQIVVLSIRRAAYAIAAIAAGPNLSPAERFHRAGIRARDRAARVSVEPK